MVVSTPMILSNIKSSGSLNLICSVNLHAWKLINLRILSLLDHLILMRSSHGMFKLEIFCKLSEDIQHQFLPSKWPGKNLSQGHGIKHLRFIKSLLENSMLKLYNIVHKSQLSQFIQVKLNALQPQ